MKAVTVEIQNKHSGGTIRHKALKWDKCSLCTEFVQYFYQHQCDVNKKRRYCYKCMEKRRLCGNCWDPYLKLYRIKD